MDRLTARDGFGTPYYPYCDNVKGCGGYCAQCSFETKTMDKLAQYEDLEEQGLLLRLPCNVGDTVYCIYERYTKCSENEQEFDEYSCQGCECLECDSHKELYVQSQKVYSLDWIVSNLKRFGKTVFLTQAEAEQKLKEMESK